MGEKSVSSLLALFLNSVLGRNSPVNNTTMVESMVSAATRIPTSSGSKSVLSKNLANKMP